MRRMESAKAAFERGFGAPLSRRPEIEAWSPIPRFGSIRRALERGSPSHRHVLGHAGGVVGWQMLPRSGSGHFGLPAAVWTLTLTLRLHCARHFLSGTVRV